jgi:glucokinase
VKIGVDIGGTNLRAGLKKGKKLIKQESIALRDKDCLDCTLSQVKELIQSVFDPSVTGIGIGVPSVVDQRQGIVYNVVNIPSWEKVYLADILKDEFGVPVFINNDSNCFTLGEHCYGHLKPYRSAVGITIGTGLGGGIIANNRLYCGHNCGAGEMGMVPYMAHNVEYYCSNNFFRAFHNTSAYETYQLAKKGEENALKLWEEFGQHLGRALKIIMYTYDPEAIAVGGSIAQASEFFEKAARDELQDFAYPESIRQLRIFFSSIPNVALLGAAALTKTVALPDGQ